MKNINLRWTDWREVVLSKPFNKNFILYRKPMLQITGYIIQTTYLSRIPNPGMFSPDHVTMTPHVTTFLLFIFIWFIWTLVWPWSSSSSNWASSSLFESVFSIIHHIKVFNLFWHNDVCFINLFQCFAIITKASFEHSGQVRSLRTILWQSNLREYKAVYDTIYFAIFPWVC